MSDAVTTTKDGKGVFLTCQNPSCRAESSTLPITPALAGDYWCGLCGEWGFDFDLVGLTEEQTWPDRLILCEIGPLGPDGKDGTSRPVNINPRWTKPA